MYSTTTVCLRWRTKTLSSLQTPPSPHVTMLFSQWMIALSHTHWARSPLTPLLTLPPPPPLHLFFPSPCCQSPAIPSKEYTSYCDDPVCLHPGKQKKTKQLQLTTLNVCQTANVLVFDGREEKKSIIFFAWCLPSVCPIIKTLWIEPGKIKNQKCYFILIFHLIPPAEHWRVAVVLGEGFLSQEWSGL